jgi:aminopeptidase N
VSEVADERRAAPGPSATAQVLFPLLESGSIPISEVPRLLALSPVEALREVELLVQPFPDAPACFELDTLAPPDVPDSIDVLHYDLHVWEITPETTSMQGEATLTLHALRSLDALDLHLAMVGVESLLVERGGTWAPIAWTHADDLLHVDLGAGVPSGQELRLRIRYGGTPMCGYAFYKGMVFSERGVHTFTEPGYARHWFPGHDVPRDKATLRLTVDLPASDSASATGELKSREPLPGGEQERWVWEMTHPIATYLIAFYAGDYLAIDGGFGGGVPVTYYTFPDIEEATRSDFSSTPDMLDFYQTFHPYPFDSYSMTVGVFPGGMEHQSNSLIGETTVRGDRGNEWLNAHELAHQWWGDMITPEAWRDMWLNEGFATYFDLLYTEHAYGADAFRERLDTIFGVYFWGDSLTVARGNPRHAILDLPPESIFSFLNYNKGAAVLQMLRGLAWMRLAPTGWFTDPERTALQSEGDSLTLEVFRRYADRHAYGNATTADFQQAAEEVLGTDLSGFFDQWLAQPGHPELRVDQGSIPSTDGVVMRVRIRQVQTDGPYYTMPVQVSYQGAQPSVTEVVWISGPETNWETQLPPGDWIALVDPEDWLLDETETGSSINNTQTLLMVGANPSSSGFRLSLELEATESTEGRFAVYDAAGRRVHARDLELLAPGINRLEWDGSLDGGRAAAAGVYFARVDAGSKSWTRRLVVLPR